MNKSCFVIMPFSTTISCTGEEWTEIFEDVIKPSVEDAGLNYKCTRSIAARGAIISDVLANLNSADVVIADITDRNPNVFYELGVRHSLRNGAILITKNISDIPFDLKPYGVIEYDLSPSGVREFKARIREIIIDFEKNPDKPDNPVADFLSATGRKMLSPTEISTIVNNKVDKELDKELIKLDNAITKKFQEQFEIYHAQLQETITEISLGRQRNDLYGVTHDEQTVVEGIYEGETGILELMQEENYIEGKYQFDTEEFIGRLTGTLEGDIIKFKYYWIDGKQQGSGIFNVSSDGQYLDGYYFQSIEINNLSMQDYENLRNSWSFTKHS